MKETMSANNNITDKELHNDERISTYLRGGMTAEEDAAFQKDLEADGQLRSQAVSVARLAKAMKQVGEQQDKEVKEALLASDEESVRRIAAKAAHKARVVVLRRRLVKVISAAACLLVLVGVGLRYYDYRTITGLGDTYTCAIDNGQSPSLGPSKGTENEPIAKELEGLYANVRDGKDLDATIKRLSVLWEVSTLDTYNDYTNESPLIGWNLAIAYLKNDDKASAVDVLTKLVSRTEDGNAINVEARKLLEKLK